MKPVNPKSVLLPNGIVFVTEVGEVGTRSIDPGPRRDGSARPSRRSTLKRAAGRARVPGRRVGLVRGWTERGFRSRSQGLRNMLTSLLLDGLRHQKKAVDPGAQTERPELGWPARARLTGSARQPALASGSADRG